MSLNFCFAAAAAPRANAFGLLFLLPILSVATVACDDSTARDQTDEEEELDATHRPADPSKPDASGTASARADGGGAEVNVDAGSKAPDAAPFVDAGLVRSDGAVEAGGQPGSDGSSAKPGDAATPSERGDAAGQGPSQSDDTIAMTIPTPSNGAGEVRPAATVLKSAQNGGKDVWDFQNQKIGVNNTIDCEGGEGQLTVFEVEDGVTVKNLIVAGGVHGGNGIVCKGNCTLDHVYWEDVCEDAATNSKDGATMILDHVIALHASDKVFQHNAKAGAKTVIKNSYVADFGKLWRSCGDCEANGGPRHLEIDNVRVEGIKTCVAGANQNYRDTVTVKNLYVKGGYDAAKDKPKICQEYIAVTDHNGESTKVKDGASQWNSATCKLSVSDVKSY